MDVRNRVLAHAKTLSTVSDIAYSSDLLPAELMEMLDDRAFKITFEQARIHYRTSLLETLLNKGTGTQLLELWLRALPENAKREARHPREVKDEEDDFPDDIVIMLTDA